MMWVLAPSVLMRKCVETLTLSAEIILDCRNIVPGLPQQNIPFLNQYSPLNDNSPYNI